MNKGMPNTAKLLASSLTAASGLTGILGWILNLVLKYVLRNGIQKGLVIADSIHVAIIVKREAVDMNEVMDGAYAIIDQGKELTQEEKDAIDKPVMDAFRKLATFRVRKPTGNS